MSHIIGKEEGGQLDGLKVAKSYSYNASTKTVTVAEDDFKEIVSIYNETVDRTLFIRGSEKFTGTLVNGFITHDINISGTSNVDKLYIVYKPDIELDEQSYLRDVKSLLEQNLVQSKLIARILQDSFESGIEDSDIKYK